MYKVIPYGVTTMGSSWRVPSLLRGGMFQSSREWSVKLTIHAKGQRFELDQNKCEL
jgi:hypothetical protein